jgi:hypothetical protein
MDDPVAKAPILISNQETLLLLILIEDFKNLSIHAKPRYRFQELHHRYLDIQHHGDFLALNNAYKSCSAEKIFI